MSAPMQGDVEGDMETEIANFMVNERGNLSHVGSSSSIGSSGKKAIPRLDLPQDDETMLDDGDINAGTYTRVHLRVRAETRIGEELHCSGASYTMGQYNPSESIELVTTPEEYPIWRTSKPLILPRGIAHRYMYALFLGGTFSKWENIDQDRVIVPEGREMTIAEDYDTYDPNSVLQKTSEIHNRSIVYMRKVLTHSAKQAQITGKTDVKGIVASAMQRSSSILRFRQGGTKEKMQPRFKRHASSNYKPDLDATLYLICYHLPIHLTKVGNQWTAEWDKDSLIARSEGTIAQSMDVKWVGCVAMEYNGSPMTPADVAEITELLRAMDAHAVFITPELAVDHYQGYCKSKLWPMFHNVDILDIYSSVWDDGEFTSGKEEKNNGRWWAAYQEVNRLMATAVATLVKPKDILWVHDYHLLLLPKLVVDFCKAAAKPRPQIVFFLHVPFPTSEIFRELSNGTALLEGVLEVDVVGFHTFDHARHFLNACKRFLGLTYQSRCGVNLGVDYKGRNVVITISHVGIEKEIIRQALLDPAVQAAAAALREKHKGKQLIAGIDPCQRLSGIPLKLLAFEQFFSMCSNLKDKLVLVQRCHFSTARLGDEQYSSQEIRELVQRIKTSHGDVIDYAESEKPLGLHDRVALWLACDILMVTSIRGGLNLYPLEYVFAKGAAPGSKAGVVILSEFSGCCCVLNGGLRVNPWNITEVVNSLDRAINMSDEERMGRRARDLPYITSQPSSNWTRQVLAILQECSEDDDDASLDFQKLDVAKVQQAYKTSRRRVFLLDYGGTIISRENISMYMKKDFTAVTGKIPTARMMASLQKLCADPDNTVFIISGVSQVNLTNVLGHIDGLGLAPDNGALFSWARSIRFGTAKEGAFNNDGGAKMGVDTHHYQPKEASDDRSWFHHRVEFDWQPIREIVDPILKTYLSRTNGSVIRYMDQGIAWNFRSTDPEWGLIQANSLQTDLEEVIKDLPITIVRKKGLLEIVPEGLNKGVVARHILSSDAELHRGHPDFIFCIGDDTTDESMFKCIYEYYAERSEESVHGRSRVPSTDDGRLHITGALQHVFTCTVGKKPSNAHLYLNNVEDVENLLYSLGHP
ncbi:trehalose-phosphatase [Achlya hypogyna]|uniref:Trehalose-phosphatase n=1 Tax=Achlya hypogyna TaxID=1202772 RepID=A0A1V9YNQ3_ACHHY|nr:trehalose-phosphatase [Achlya hypogyna]